MKIKIELENDVRLVWPTPIFNRVFPDTDKMNARLLKIVRQKEREDKGIAKSIIGGWHSADDLHKWHYPEVERLLGFMSEAVTELTKLSTGVTRENFSADTSYVAWANILRKGGYHKAHTHPGSAWSGVYYIEAGTDDETEIPDDAGSIEFFDPRHGVEMVPVPGNPFGQRISFPAENGRLLCFPAWLRHTVNPYLGKHERVSIAFNVRIEKFESFD
jgi:uncharacterized protein (TIGR02466 family)